MKKKLSLFLALALMVGMLAGCGGTSNDTTDTNTNDTTTTTPNTDQTGNETEPTTDSLSGVVNTDGSTSMADVMAVLQESFKELYPDVTVNYSGTGSGAGVEAALSGTADIGLASRALKDEEKAEGAVENIIALDGVAVVVNPANGVEDLSVEDIAKIFTGEITNWSELGGEDLEIAVLGREDGSGTRTAFEEIVGVEEMCIRDSFIVNLLCVCSTPRGVEKTRKHCAGIQMPYTVFVQPHKGYTRLAKQSQFMYNDFRLEIESHCVGATSPAQAMGSSRSP